MSNQEASAQNHSTVISDRHTRGSCLCGKISYEITGEPRHSALCHCANCKKTSGAAFASIFLFGKDQVKITGEENLHTYEDHDTSSGDVLQRRFCSNCGSPLFFVNAREAVVVTSGSVNDAPAEWRPKMEVFNKDRVCWLPEIEGTFTMSGYYSETK